MYSYCNNVKDYALLHNHTIMCATFICTYDVIHKDTKLSDAVIAQGFHL